MRGLCFTKSAGYEHSVVRRSGGRPSHSEAILAALGKQHDIDFTFCKDGSLYNAMGHREDIWETPEFHGLLLGGIAWAGGRIDADVTPNLSAVAAQANVRPPATN